MTTATAVPAARRPNRHATRLIEFLRFAGRRLISLAAILAGLVVVTFLMTRFIPGDPAVVVGGISATAEEIEIIREQLGLNMPVWEQFGQYLVNLSQGNLGQSFFSQQPVTQLILQRLPSSLQLASASLLFVLIISVPLGIIIAAFTRDGRRRRFELGFTAVTSVLGSLPEFLTATFLAFLFAVTLRLLPVAGSQGPEALILPVLAISLRSTAILARIVRVETLNVLASDFIRTARGKRLPNRLVYARHTLPNVLTAALTVGGLLFAGIIGGAVVVENVFARPGLGSALVQAVLVRDYPIVQGVVLVLGVAVVVVNAIVDLILAAVDPRTAAGKV